MDENEKREDSLTDDEARDVERDDVSGEEAHREGEFDFLRDKVDEIYNKLDRIADELSSRIDSIKENMAAMAVENGATVHEDETEIPDEVPELEELDLSI